MMQFRPETYKIATFGFPEESLEVFHESGQIYSFECKHFASTLDKKSLYLAKGAEIILSPHEISSQLDKPCLSLGIKVLIEKSIFPLDRQPPSLKNLRKLSLPAHSPEEYAIFWIATLKQKEKRSFWTMCGSTLSGCSELERSSLKPDDGLILLNALALPQLEKVAQITVPLQIFYPYKIEGQRKSDLLSLFNRTDHTLSFLSEAFPAISGKKTDPAFIRNSLRLLFNH